MIISSTASARETLGYLRPFHDAFVALFFVTIGALVDPRALFLNVPALLAIVVNAFLVRSLVGCGGHYGYPFGDPRSRFGSAKVAEFAVIGVSTLPSQAGHLARWCQAR